MLSLEEIMSLAKKASTPDVAYLVESSYDPILLKQDVRVRRVVEMTGLETVYTNTDEHGARPLEEGLLRMQREIDARNVSAKRHSTANRGAAGREEVLACIAEHERMCSGEGPTVTEIAEVVGLVKPTAQYYLNKLLEEHLVRRYEDPMTFSSRYKAVKRK